ncbi:sugar-binding domain-containing protein [Planctomycetota bacterium]
MQARNVIVGSLWWLLLFSMPIYGEGEWAPVGDKIKTPWAWELDPENCLPDYPRPQMVRKHWKNLNGLWDYAITEKEADSPFGPDEPSKAIVRGKILVPFAIESALSGVGKKVGADQHLWYRRSFILLKKQWSERVLLHFGAVDWESTVWVNGHLLGTHQGGYDPFSYEVTHLLRSTGEQEIVVRVWDPTDQDNATQPRGKQVNDPHGTFYSSVTGIWQTVWLEPVGTTFIRSLKIVPSVDEQQVTVTAEIEGNSEDVEVVARAKDGWFVRGQADTTTGTELTLKLKNPHLWSPDDPFLYDLTVTLDVGGRRCDQVTSYFGMRKIGVASDHEGYTRFCLNDQPLFLFGPLDQGWWPDGLYTAATDAALHYDLDMTKQLGFNMLRKHVKVEPQRFYAWCDRIGLLVWQDMPSCLYNRKTRSAAALAAADQQFDLELQRMMEALHNHPSIVMWIPFHEGWGQHDTERISAWIKEQDPTRLVNNASGWTDKQVGDVRDIHVYPGPGMPGLENDRAAVLGEFGGLALPIAGHLWQKDGNWGYRAFKDAESYSVAYTQLITELYGLAEKGLAGAVYSQTSDCEIEINGLITYDRQHIKLDPASFNSLNRGLLPPRFGDGCETFLHKRAVRLHARDPYAQIRYTLNGRNPSRFSHAYTYPFEIEDDVTIKARCYWTDGQSSVVVSRDFKKVSDFYPAEKRILENRGLEFAYYQGRWTALPDFSTLTPDQTGVSQRMNLVDVNDSDYFAMRFTGYFRARFTGVYSFYSRSDDGSLLRIAGQEVVSNDGVHGMQEARGEIALETGWHALELLYFQGHGTLGLNVSYEGPYTDKQAVPVSVLSF